MLQRHEPKTFVEKMERFLERVEYRRADDPESKAQIYRMRHEAYLREGSITPRSSGLFTDETDEAPNAFLIGVYVDGELASSIRLHIACRPEHTLPAAEIYRDVVRPHLEAGECLIDATRQVTKLEATRAFPQMPILTMRTTLLAVDYFEGDYILAACRVEHQPAFRRLYNGVDWSPAQSYPLLSKPQALMAFERRKLREEVRLRFPFYNSTPRERELLFGRSSTQMENTYEALHSRAHRDGSADRELVRLSEHTF